MQIELVPVDNLTPYARNARTHSKKQLRQIADSIRSRSGSASAFSAPANSRFAARDPVCEASVAATKSCSTCSRARRHRSMSATTRQ